MDHFESFGISSGTCSAFSPEQFNQQFSSSNRKLFIMNFNIRSFNANIGEFSLFLDELVRIPDVIILTETWNSDDLSADIDNYRSYHCNRPNNRRGGGGKYDSALPIWRQADLALGRFSAAPCLRQFGAAPYV